MWYWTTASVSALHSCLTQQHRKHLMATRGRVSRHSGVFLRQNTTPLFQRWTGAELGAKAPDASQWCHCHWFFFFKCYCPLCPQDGSMSPRSLGNEETHLPLEISDDEFFFLSHRDANKYHSHNHYCWWIDWSNFVLLVFSFSVFLSCWWITLYCVS